MSSFLHDALLYYSWICMVFIILRLTLILFSLYIKASLYIHISHIKAWSMFTLCTDIYVLTINMDLCFSLFFIFYSGSFPYWQHSQHSYDVLFTIPQEKKNKSDMLDVKFMNGVGCFFYKAWICWLEIPKVHI